MTETKFSHIKSGETPYEDGGLRSFFRYRDLGVRDATNGAVLAQLVRAHDLPDAGGTGLHTHQMQFHIVYMLTGWAKFRYEGKETLVEAGDCVHQRPGILHELFDWSPDMEFLEVIGPADYGTQEA